ncbi:MAG TPA: S41 family peptidase, partial [Opitutaceae bacterium]|nr:S41 family peptidase [Opitutaceae bacterium]
MGKRLLTLSTGALVGAFCLPGMLRLGLLWGLFPGGDLGHASGYVREALQAVHDNYVDPKAASYDALTRSAIHGMLDSLDPHSEYLEAKDNQQLEEDLSGEFGGIGVEVEVRDKRIVVVAPIAGTPGARAGILRGDEITSIEGKRLGSGANVSDVADQLRGKPKTKVTLGLFRPSASRNFELTLTREIIKVDSVGEVRVIDGDIGYIQLKEFSDHTGDQFIAALNGLLKKNISSLVLDLRNNPGGLLDAAVDVAEPFFKKGELIVYTQGRKPSDREDYRAESDDPRLDLPVAVLINWGTASAAEIVTGALKDTGRAVIVGERSFGKGSVQQMFDLKNGESLRLTIAKYYTPSGVSIHEKGIAPQVEVVMSPEDDFKLSQQHDRPEVTNPKEFKELFGFEPIRDRQLEAAVDVLKGVDLLDGQAEAAAKSPP